MSFNFLAKFVILLLCTSSLSHPSARAQNIADAESDAERGISFARSRNWAEAEQELRKAVSAAPAVALYRAQLGSILGLESKWSESLSYFQKAVDLDPANVGFRRETAAVQWQLGLMDAAERNVSYILKRQPNDPGANLLFGLIADARGDYVGAAALLGAQFDLAVSQPDRAIVFFHSLMRSGHKTDVGRVIEVLRSHVSDPSWMTAIVQCATIAATGDDLETAEKLYALIPASDDLDQRAAAIPLATLHYRRGQVDRAQELVFRLIQRGWVSADAQALLGNCFESQGQAFLALEAYSKAVEIDPSKVAGYDDLISLQLALGKTNDAIALANRAVAIAPKNARAWVLKGNAELRTNAYKDALESYRHAAKLDSSNPDTILLIGGLHFISGENDAAIAEYKVGIDRFPHDSRFYVNCAEVLLGSPDSLELRARAETLLQKAVKLAPDSSEAHYQLGQLALRRGRLQDAENEFSASLQSDPNRSRTHYAMSLVYRRMGRSNQAEKQFAMYQDLKRVEENGTGVAEKEVVSGKGILPHPPPGPTK
jgi:tetratricopeptide (TPR) repeat protein